VATKSGDVEGLREAATLWKKAGWKEVIVQPEDMVCHGCTSVKWCRYEAIRKCSREGEIDNCGQCGHYPCEKIMRVFEQTKLYAEFCLDKLSKDDYVCFEKAFFSKKEKLDRIHEECRSQ
jgi:hypothetical protein